MSRALERVTSSRSQSFEEAYRALDAEFGAKGELERREVLERWVDDASAPPDAPIQRTYHLLVARAVSGELAGVRDCHVLIEPTTRIAVVYLAHVLVLPPHRRTGLARKLREEPIRLVDGALAEAGHRGFDRVLAAEMEPPSLDDPASLVRLIAYGKDGYSALSPDALPYFQPDFQARGGIPRNPSDGAGAPPDPTNPLPLLAVVRWLGHEHTSTVPKRLARAVVRQLYTAFATHVPRAQLEPLEQSILSRLDAFPESEVPLLALPRSLDDRTALARLSHPGVSSTPRCP